MTHHRLAALVLAAALVAGACSNASRPEFGETTLPPTTSGDTDVATPTTVATTTTAPVIIHPPAPSGRTYPAVPTDQRAAAQRLFQVERRIHTLDTDDELFADVAHEQQMLYRTIGRHPDWIPALLADAPPEYAPIIEQHLAARRSIAGIGFGSNSGPPMNVPAWEIIEPLPVDELRALYDRAEEATGIDWAFLAAINLLETGFGRIDGLSTAGAQGPMQFLPTTFEEVSDGDIRDPLDAIPAAARYLVRRGGPDDMSGPTSALNKLSGASRQWPRSGGGYGGGYGGGNRGGNYGNQSTLNYQYQNGVRVQDPGCAYSRQARVLAEPRRPRLRRSPL